MELAIADVMLRASRDGRHELVMACVEELRARRLERQSGGASNVIPFPRR